MRRGLSYKIIINHFDYKPQYFANLLPVVRRPFIRLLIILGDDFVVLLRPATGSVDPNKLQSTRNLHSSSFFFSFVWPFENYADSERAQQGI